MLTHADVYLEEARVEGFTQRVARSFGLFETVLQCNVLLLPYHLDLPLQQHLYVLDESIASHES